MARKRISGFPIRVGNAILCENTRAELGGKYTLIGVFSGDIIVTELEKVLLVSLYIELFGKNLGQIELELAVSYENIEVMKMRGEFDYKDMRDPAVIASPTFGINLRGEGSIVVIASYGERSLQLMEKRVRLRNTS